jgi:hypothetical protein
VAVSNSIRSGRETRRTSRPGDTRPWNRPWHLGTGRGSARGLAKGKLLFKLHGEKLAGLWELVHIIAGHRPGRAPKRI